MINYRYDEFLQTTQALLITGEVLKVPAVSKYYVPLREIPRKDTPASTILVRNAASSSSSNPDQDCSVLQPTNANDNSPNLYVGRDSLGSGGGLYRAFLRFDISALPTNPGSVKLRVYCNGSFYPDLLTAPISVHQVTSSWTETGPTWTVQPTYNTSPASAFAATADNPKSGITSGWLECDITALYNTWKAGTNYGLMLKGDESVYGNQLLLASRSGGSPPQLVLVSAGNVYTEMGATVDPGSMEFAAHYGTGRLRFHSSAAGLSLLVDYYGIGSPVDAQDVPVWCGTTAGTSTAFTVSPSTFITLVPGLRLTCKLHTGNGTSATLNASQSGAKPIFRGSTAAAAGSGVLVSGGVYDFVYDGTNYIVMGV